MGPDVAAGTSLAMTGVRAAGTFGPGKYIERQFDYAVSSKRSCTEAEAQVHTLVSKAAGLLNHCPIDEGFEETVFSWFTNIKVLINDFESSKIAKKIHRSWLLTRDNIRKFESNNGFRTEDYEHITVVEPRDRINRRWACLKLNAGRIGRKSTEFYDTAKSLNNEYETMARLKRENALYKKRRTDQLPTQIDMNDLIIKASYMLDECAVVNRGVHNLQLNWFVRVKELIDDFKKSKVAVEIPDGWSHVRDNIHMYSAGQWYQPEGYAKVVPADIMKPLVTGRMDIDLTEFSRRARELMADDEKNWKDGERVRPLYKTKPRCAIPPDYERLGFITFGSRSRTKDEILRSLKEHNVTLVHGPGGIGKTTMLYQIAETAEKDRLFATVVYATVPRDPRGADNIQKFHKKLAEQLGVPWPPTPSVVTADDMFATLKTKIEALGNVLVILDDVWEVSDVITIWISTTPPPGVKVLIGTRMSDLSIQLANPIPLGILSDPESLSLLERGAQVNGDINCTLVEQIRDECGGLPLALDVIGKALVRKTNADWKCAASCLKNSMPSKCPNLKGVEAKLYKIIKYSYDHLPNDMVTKRMFLCCCLFKESEEVHAEDLKRYLAKDAKVDVDVNELEDDVLASAQILEQYGLLKNNIRTHGVVKMHDVVRDVGVYIAREDKYAIIRWGPANKKINLGNLEKGSLAKCERLSLTDTEVGVMPYCPQLVTLLIRGNTDLPKQYLWKMKSTLAVLDLSYSDISELPSFPENFNVRTLLLNGCKNLTEVDKVVELSKLGELSLRQSVVQLLPKDLVLPIALDWEDSSPKADNKPLAVTDEHVPGKLKELSIYSRYLTVKAYKKIAELQNLEAVKLYVTYSVLSSDAFTVENTSKWKKFIIYNHDQCPPVSQGKHLSIVELEDVLPGVKELLKKTEEAVITNCFDKVTMPEESTVRGTKTVLVLTEATGEGTFKETKILHLSQCPNISYLTSKDGAALENLEEMELTNLKELLGIFKPLESADTSTDTFFKKVEKIAVTSCGEMISVVPNELLQKVQKTLQKVSVKKSKKVKYIFDSEGNSSVTLTKLTSIEVDDLKMLECIWQGIAPQGAFQKLIDFTVRKCNKLTSLFTTHVAAQLKDLQKLTVQDNSGLTEIISANGSDAEITEQPFPCVTHLSLQRLPILKHFSSDDMNIAWPSLVKLKLEACPNLERLPIGLGKAEHLKIIDLASENDWAWYKPLESQDQSRRFEKWVNNKRPDISVSN